MSKYLIVANWKNNPATQDEAQELFNSVNGGINNNQKTEIVICPPFIFLPTFRGFTSENGVILGAQNFDLEGEESVETLKEIGCQYIILGHSERRVNLGETDETVNNKIKTALENNLKPILCVGDKKRESKEDFSEVVSQLKEDLNGVKEKDAQNIIIAYEPVWAISNMGGRPATPEDIKESSDSIREILSELFGNESASQIKILYGGSVDSDNVKNILLESGVQGALIGAASLKADEFLKIINNI